MKVTKDQIKVLHAVLPKEVIADKEQKKTFVYSFTNDPQRTSTTKLTFKEANDALVSLGAKAHDRPFVRLTEWQRFDYKKPSHMNILSLLRQLGWTVKSQTSARLFADMVRFGNWLEKGKAPVNKPLSKMHAIEISKTIIALEYMVAGKEKKNNNQK